MQSDMVAFARISNHLGDGLYVLYNLVGLRTTGPENTESRIQLRDRDG